MSIEITFVRHGETDANAGSIWQGQGDAVLSEIGREQARALPQRLGNKAFDFVVSSDLVRAMETAELAGLDPTPDPGWREMDIGAWEGLTRDEVRDRFPEELRRMGTGDRDVRMGGGESWNEFSARVDRSMGEVLERAPSGSRVLVMAHGGVIHSVLANRLGFRGARPWPISRLLNASVTELVLDTDRAHLQVLNDARHAPVITGHEEVRGLPVALIRHGETVANIEGRWHGRTDGPLTDLGSSQGAELAARYNGITRVVSSPLQRARLTAAAFADFHGLEVAEDGDLTEMDFGAWEDRTTSEISEAFPDQWERTFAGGIDEPRGGTGETFGDTGLRVARAVKRLTERYPTDRLALFTHGGSIWALASRILGFDWTGWRKLAIPGNASTSHLRYDGGAPVLIDYNLPI